MLLNELLNNVKTVQVVGSIHLIDVGKITLDSREVDDSTVFVAVKGFKADGHKFIPEAVEKGAIAIVLDNDDPNLDQFIVSNNVVKILVHNSRKAFAQLCDSFYGSPSRKLNLIGISGTKGKTTTSYFIKNIFDTAGKKSGLIGTNRNMIGDREIPTKLTTPESNTINKLLTEMVQEGCDNCVMEVSSHSVDLSRVDYLNFNIGVFTNITSDHLDFHKNFENYLSAKKKFFEMLGESDHLIYNSDDANSSKVMGKSKAKKISYSAKKDAEFRILDVDYSLEGTHFNLLYKDNKYPVSTSLIGLFNAYNATAAIGTAVYSGISIKEAISGIKSTPQVPGRFEVINANEKKIIIDYSHTADSLKQALEAIKHIVKNERPVYTVFGCGGDRDKTKRPEMGRIAESYSQFVYVTSDNPRTEDPFEIINDIESGMINNNHKIVEDRAQAIKTAIKKSEKNAVILIAGKGHENYQEINGIRNYFSDKEVAEKYI